MELEMALKLANELRAELSPYCVRVEIAGSIRRQKAEPHDIELIAIPQVGTYEIPNLFGETQSMVTVNRLEDALAEYLTTTGPWNLDDQLRRDGPRYKRLRHKLHDIACDLFITDARRWVYTFTIRTGPGDLSTALVTRAHHLRMFFSDGLLHGHPPLYHNQQTLPCPIGARCGQIIDLTDEVDLFTALNLPYIAPERRSQVDCKRIVDVSAEARLYIDRFRSEASAT